MTVPSAWACPECKSENVKSLAVVHGTGTMPGIGQSAIASIAAPPSTGTRPLAVFLAFAIPSAFVGYFADPSGEMPGSADTARMLYAIAALLFVCGIIGALLRARSVRHVNAAAIERWKRQFLCERCGTVFERTP